MDDHRSPHRQIKHEARVIAQKLGHALRPFDASIRVMFPLYITTCYRCGRPAVVRPRPMMFEPRFSGSALEEVCPRRGAKDGPEINVSSAPKPVASKLGGV